jgi:glycosyltransferase involved in cell wall biosynthesis
LIAKTMDYTVAICTYRRHEPLRRTLASLVECAPVQRDWELLVIDNANDPTVKAIVESFQNTLPHLRYQTEAKLGIAHGRNRATQLARAPVILFTDDDVTLDHEWLLRMVGAIETHPECAFWGGRVEPVWDGPVPRWFAPNLCESMGDAVVRYQRGTTPRPWDPAGDPPFYTANLALRVERIAQAGYFETTLGHQGKKRLAAEDSLMVLTINSQGGRGWYAADAVVHHPVPAERATRAHARRFAWRQGFISMEMTRRQAALEGRPTKLPRWMYRVALEQSLAGVGQWGKGAATFNPAQAFAGQYRTIFNLSKLYHAIKQG